MLYFAIIDYVSTGAYLRRQQIGIRNKNSNTRQVISPVMRCNMYLNRRLRDLIVSKKIHLFIYFRSKQQGWPVYSVTIVDLPAWTSIVLLKTGVEQSRQRRLTVAYVRIAGDRIHLYFLDRYFKQSLDNGRPLTYHNNRML